MHVTLNIVFNVGERTLDTLNPLPQVFSPPSAEVVDIVPSSGHNSGSYVALALLHSTLIFVAMYKYVHCRGYY